MDSKEMLRQVEKKRVVTAADEAKRASRARAKEAVEQLKDVREAVKVGNQMARDLIASFERLHGLTSDECPAVVASGVRIPTASGDQDSTVFGLSEGVFMRVTKHGDRNSRPGDRASYRMSLVDDPSIPDIPNEGHHILSLGSISLGETDGFHPEIHPGLNKYGGLRNNVVNLFEATENMRTVEQELGLPPLPSAVFKLPALPAAV